MPPGAVRTGNAGRPSVLPRPMGPGILGEAKSQQCFPHEAVFGTGLAASTSAQAGRVLPGQITAPWCPGARVAVPSAVHRIHLLNGWKKKHVAHCCLGHEVGCCGLVGCFIFFCLVSILVEENAVVREFSLVQNLWKGGVYFSPRQRIRKKKAKQKFVCNFVNRRATSLGF
ncbi:putative trans-sialidase [Trypanosoma cruzi]|nr:putative trans-sialidase [Trypanosoma cruzi]